jgi:hypothetical protein
MTKKVKRPVAEIAEEKIEWLKKRIDAVREQRTQAAVRGGMNADGFEALAGSYQDAIDCLKTVQNYLSDILSPAPKSD